MTIQLTRLFLNNSNKYVQRDMVDCYEMHRSVLSMFDDITNVVEKSRTRILYRGERVNDYPNLTRLIIQSPVRPDWSRLPKNYLGSPPSDQESASTRDVETIYARLVQGDHLKFRMLTNPTKTISNPDNRAKGIRTNISDNPECINWLIKKGSLHGFEIMDHASGPSQPTPLTLRREVMQGWKRPHASNPTQMIFNAIMFEGMIRITNPDHFKQSLMTGIGHGKAFGFGLLSISAAK